jgi:hypothetical protein
MSDRLTVSDGTNMAIVKLTGNYSSHSFHFVDHGNEISGKLVYASPVPTSDPTASATIVAMARDPANDVFVFVPSSQDRQLSTRFLTLLRG